MPVSMWKAQTCGGSKQGGGTLRPKIFSILCSFSEILAKSYVGAPRGLAPPPAGNPGFAPVDCQFEDLVSFSVLAFEILRSG